MAAVRTATVTWQGSLTEGSGSVSAGTSGLFTDLPVTWGSRTEGADGRTSTSTSSLTSSSASRKARTDRCSPIT